jgi:DNA-binding transcriptional MerR regulator
MAERLRPDAPVFGISVAAELTGVNPQTLRAYEAKGLLDPQRTAGGTRRYSSDDLERVRRICLLLESGLNLEGVRQVLGLQDEAALLRAELAGYRDEATRAE